MANFIVSPDRMEFVAWANQVIISFKGGVIPSPTSEDKWKQWASSLVPIKALGRIPNPNGYSDWRKWARSFINSVNSK